MYRKKYISFLQESETPADDFSIYATSVPVAVPSPKHKKKTEETSDDLFDSGFSYIENYMLFRDKYTQKK